MRADGAHINISAHSSLGQNSSYEPRSILLVDQKDMDPIYMYWGFSRALNTTAIKNPLPSLNMALLSIILTEAHMKACCTFGPYKVVSKN